MSFTDEFEKIVMAIAKQAQENATCFADRIEALKALNTSYGLMMKHKQDAPDDDDDFNFAKAAAITEEPPNGTSKVRARTGRN